MALQISHTFSQARINAGFLMAKKHFVSQDISQGDVCCVTTKICFTGCFTWLPRGSKSILKFHRLRLSCNFVQGALIISHGFSQGVSHAKKIHMVFTCISHSFHRVAPSSGSRHIL